MKEFKKLINIIKKLRDPDTGCPWDRKQTDSSLKEYILEEAYELLEAIDSGSDIKKKEELGDLLLQIILISQINSEKGNFTINDVITGLNKKLIERHPHIFGDVLVENAEEVKKNWEKIKKITKSKKSILSDYPQNMPSLLTAKRLTEQAASVGFDWNDHVDALKKVDEELNELKDEIISKDLSGIEEELGDLLFAIVNTSRKLNINPEISLMKANKKFIKRFRNMEDYFEKKGIDVLKTDLSEMDSIWEKIKQAEKTER